MNNTAFFKEPGKPTFSGVMYFDDYSPKIAVLDRVKDMLRLFRAKGKTPKRILVNPNHQLDFDSVDGIPIEAYQYVLKGSYFIAED